MKKAILTAGQFQSKKESCRETVGEKKIRLHLSSLLSNETNLLHTLIATHHLSKQDSTTDRSLHLTLLGCTCGWLTDKSKRLCPTPSNELLQLQVLCCACLCYKLLRDLQCRFHTSEAVIHSQNDIQCSCTYFSPSDPTWLLFKK